MTNNAGKLVVCKTTKYYEVSLQETPISSNDWQCSLIIRRQDTGEIVPDGCITTYGNNKNLITKELLEIINEKREFLTTPPPDWNSKTKSILCRCLTSEQSITGWSILFDDLLSQTNKDKSLSDDFIDFCIQLIDNTIDIVKNIEKLSAEERKEILSSKEDTYKNHENPYSLDDLQARRAIFKYFLNPSAEEKNAHRFHIKRMDDDAF